MPPHVQLIHFPIAFLLLAALMAVVQLIYFRTSISRFILLLLVLGTVSAFFAVRSGESASEKVKKTLPGTEQVLEQHEENGERVLWIFTLTTMLKLVLIGIKRDNRQWNSIVVVFMILGTFLIYRTGYFGGQLVYEWGAGVKPVMEQNDNFQFDAADSSKILK
ncbi:MAG: DUF2231 domain-containing protein [Caldithrix sp.]|nr:DUF2231 domain-containing protein [Caldithrix sp.]